MFPSTRVFVHRRSQTRLPRRLHPEAEGERRTLVILRGPFAHVGHRLHLSCGNGEPLGRHNVRKIHDAPSVRDAKGPERDRHRHWKRQTDHIERQSQVSWKSSPFLRLIDVNYCLAVFPTPRQRYARFSGRTPWPRGQWLTELWRRVNSAASIYPRTRYSSLTFTPCTTTLSFGETLKTSGQKDFLTRMAHWGKTTRYPLEQASV